MVAGDRGLRASKERIAWSARPESWAAATALALLAASEWLGASGVQYLVIAVVATAASIVFSLRDGGEQRSWRLVSTGLLAVMIALMLPVQSQLRAIDMNWETRRREIALTGTESLRDALDAAVTHALRTADAAVAAPRDREAAFDVLDRNTRTSYESGVVLFEGDSVLAWGGQIRLPVDDAPEGLDVASSPFYLAIRATRSAGNRRATAMALVAAAPPGDRIAVSLAGQVAARTGVPGFDFATPVGAAPPADEMRYAIAGAPLFDVRPAPATQGSTRYAVLERARLVVGLALSIALIGFVIAVWRRWRELPRRLGALSVALACTAIVPLNAYSNLSRLFNPSVYRAATGDQFTGNAGVLALTSAILLSAIILVVRRRGARVRRVVGATIVLLVAGLGPFLLRDLARGIVIPETGVDTALWLIWEIPLFLAAVTVLLAGTVAGAFALGQARRLSPWIAPTLATGAAVLAPAVWEAPGRWPSWYVFIWIGAIAALALGRRSRYIVASAATVAALGAVTLVWGRTAKGRVELAEADLRSLNEINPDAPELLLRFAEMVSRIPSPASTLALLQRYVRSDLAPAAYPVKLYGWSAGNEPRDSLETAPVSVAREDVQAMVAEARATGSAVIRSAAAWPGRELILAAPAADSGITVVVVAPKSRLYQAYPFAQLYGIEAPSPREPPYNVFLLSAQPSTDTSSEFRWQRRGDELHGDWIATTGYGPRAAHAEVALRGLSALVQRGGLIVLINLAIVSVLWLASVVADGSAGRWRRARRRAWTRSYRARLSLAMFIFFFIPAATFAAWSYQQITAEARTIRQVLVQETLLAATPLGDAATWVRDESTRLRTPLLLYTEGELRAAGDPVIASLAPLGRLLPREVAKDLQPPEQGIANQFEDVASTPVLVGYRPVITYVDHSSRGVLAAPSGSDDSQFDNRRQDLGILVLFTTAVGALAAFWLSGIAAQQLARPIGSLRRAALSIAGGERVPTLDQEPTTEFRPVFTAFRRMAEDLNASRTALEDAQRRTAAVLRNVASGVVAVAPDGSVTLANPRAEALAGRALPAGTPIARTLPPGIVAEVEAFLLGGMDDAAFEVEWSGRQLRGQLARLSRGGAVATIDDVTDLARAQRVLAWGEMARQVAHEIKNPLTPIRLGVQHLRRARADTRVDFDAVLEQNVSRILTEIDRLDEIARSFSRYGSAPEERAPAEPIEVAAISRDVVGLERMGADDRVRWEVQGGDQPVFALARTDELKEVLLNILENARLADATLVSLTVSRDTGTDGRPPRVVIRVGDNGKGIPAHILPRIFEPHFSTRTSGSGLGLPISRQIIDGWGGDVRVESVEGKGTTVTISLRSPPSSDAPS